MSYRNDHDAALARADALERALEHARLDATRVERLEAEIAAARTRLGNAEDELAKIRPPAAPQPRAPETQLTAPPDSRMTFDPRIAIAITACVAILIGIAILRSGDPPPIHEPASTPAIVVHTRDARALLPEGLRLVNEHQRVTGIAFEYIRNDSMLDATHGRIVIDTATRAAKVPDDPSLSTGAPRPDVGYAGPCTHPTWSPGAGWAIPEGICTRFGSVPSDFPRCTIDKALALSRLAPDTLAQVKVEANIALSGWRWTVDVRDPARHVRFHFEVADAECAAL